MKLIFSKDIENEIKVQLQIGTITEVFTYTEMVNQLLIDNGFDDTQFTNLSEEESGKIKNMLLKISEIFKDESQVS